MQCLMRLRLPTGDRAHAFPRRALSMMPRESPPQLDDGRQLTRRLKTARIAAAMTTNIVGAWVLAMWPVAASSGYVGMPISATCRSATDDGYVP
jgi:hypothetical protein